MFSHFSHVWLFVSLRIVAHKASLSMRVSMQEHWSRLSYPPPGVFFLTQISNPYLLHLRHWRVFFFFFFFFLPLVPLGKPLFFSKITYRWTSPTPTSSEQILQLFEGLSSRLHSWVSQFSCSVVSYTLRPHGLQYARLPCLSPSPGGLLKLMSIKSVMPSNHLILCHHLLLLPSVFPSVRGFSSESVLGIRWPKFLKFWFWSFSFKISPTNEHPGLVSFSMDWLDLLAVQGTLKSFLQHHSSKASILQHSAFFTAQLSHPYMTTGITIALTRWTFVGKVMSLLFNMLSKLVITFLPRSKHLLISWLQSSSAVILEPPK